MPLVDCPECSTSISDRLKQCPVCRKVVPSPVERTSAPSRRGSGLVWKTLLIGLAIFLVLLEIESTLSDRSMAAKLDMPRDSSAQSRADRTRLREIQEWYEGGTLHRASSAEWLAGSKRDRVATTADWLARHYGRPEARLIVEVWENEITKTIRMIPASPTRVVDIFVSMTMLADSQGD